MSADKRRMLVVMQATDYPDDIGFSMFSGDIVTISGTVDELSRNLDSVCQGAKAKETLDNIIALIKEGRDMSDITDILYEEGYLP